MAERIGEYKILKRPKQYTVCEQDVIGETVGYKLGYRLVLSHFRGARLELDRNWEYTLEGSNPASLRMRSLDCGDTYKINHENWKDIKSADFCIRRNLVFLLIVQSQNINILCFYILTLDGELVSENRTEFGTKTSSLGINKAHFVIDAQSTAVNLLIETSAFRGVSEKTRVSATPGISLIPMEERVWYECKCFRSKPIKTSGMRSNSYDAAILREDELFYLQLESNVPRVLNLYNIKSQTNTEIALQTPRGPQHSESDLNLISSTYCIDHKRHKILVPYTRLQSFFSHHLLLRIFSMSGLMEREIVIWECERCPDLGLPTMYPVRSIATWSWPMEPISSTLTDDGRLLVTWFSGSNHSGDVFSTLTRLS